jgi:hypothetical protein
VITHKNKQSKVNKVKAKVAAKVAAEAVESTNSKVVSVRGSQGVIPRKDGSSLYRCWSIHQLYSNRDLSIFYSI